MAKTPQVGEPAPDFELAGTDGQFKLSEHRGERVVLLFYPGDNTPVCTKQMCSYRDSPDAFAALATRISPPLSLCGKGERLYGQLPDTLKGTGPIVCSGDV
jgi:AhpC/TSA family